MPQQRKVAIKAKCKGVIRLLKVPPDLPYESFCDLLKNSFGITQCELKYNDEEGDQVELGSDEELKEALKVGEKFGPLKVAIITSEYPTMNAMLPSSMDQSNAAQEPSADRDTESVSSVPLIKPMSTLTINEKPTPKPRPSRKHVGFYTSLCSSSLGDVETDSTVSTSTEGSLADSERKIDPKVQRTAKREPKLRGSKYYSALAEDIVSMTLDAQMDGVRQAERKETKRKAPARKAVSKKQHVDDRVESDDAPPKWFNKVVSEMSQSVTSQVLGALNGAVIASIPTINGSPIKPAKREDATYIHDGITCDGCQQIIIGPRYKCGNCPNYDLCEKCEVIDGIHDRSHVFLKLRYPGIGIGRRHGVMIPLLKDIIYKSDDVSLAEEQDKRMKEVRKKLKQMAKKKREEQVRMKKTEKKLKKLKGNGIISESTVCGLELSLLGDESYPDGTTVRPSFEFTKCWKIRNSGNVTWNEETKLGYVYGVMRSISSDEVPLPHLQPGEEGTVSVTFVAPAEPGQYFSVWRAYHNGKQFGSKMWCKIKVVQDEAIETDDDTFVDANSESTHPSQEFVPISRDPSPTTTEEPDPIFHAYTVQEYEVSETRPSAANSSETQANASDVSLLDCGELEWDTCLIDGDSPPGISEENLLNEDHSLDIEIVSNASSDDYFVIPLPPCFNPDIPLSTEDLQRPAVDPLESLAEVDPHLALDIEFTPEDETMEPEDNCGSFEEDVTVIPVSPERPTSPEVDVLPERTLTKSPSIPINIEMKSAERTNQRPLSMPDFDVRSAISEPVASQPPSLERTPLIPGRLPASPPGRAVPVVQTQAAYPEPTAIVRVYSAPDPREGQAESSSGDMEDVHWEAVRTQPPDSAPVIYEETVTIQPQAASPATPQNTAQTTAQFASTLVKRAIGTVTDTVSSFMTGKDTRTAVVFTPQETIHVVAPEILTEPVEESSDEPEKQEVMKQLQEMGFCDRQLNERLLKEHNNDVTKVVNAILHENDNDWSAVRH